MTVVPSKRVFHDHDNVYIDLAVCVIYSLCSTSLKVATNGDRNMQEVYNDCTAINYIFSYALVDSVS